MKNNTRSKVWCFTAGAVIATALTLGAVQYRRRTRGLASITPCTDKGCFLKGQSVPPVMLLKKDTPSIVFGEIPGRSRAFVGKPLHIDGHVVIVGPTGSGKSGGVENTTMEVASGFTVYIDVKRTLYKRWKALHGNSGKMCYNFDPWDEVNGNCWFDVFALMKADPSHAAEYALQIANTLIPLHGNEANEIWLKTSAAFTAGMIIYCYHNGLSFIETMDVINQKPVDELIDMVMKDFDDEAKVYLSKFQAMEKRVIAGIAMELESYLAPFSGSCVIRKALSPASGKAQLAWEKLNRRTPSDVILSFPEAEYGEMRPLFCLMVSQLVTSLARRPERTYDQNELPPVLCLLDEFPALGRIDSIAQGMQTLRSRGVTIAIFLQSFASLDLIYGRETARVIRDNCTYQVYFGANDPESRQQLSDLIGTTEVIRESTSEGVSAFGNFALSYSRSYVRDRVPTIQPQDLQVLEKLIVLTPFGNFQLNKKLVFNGERVFDKAYDHWEPSPCCYGMPMTVTAEQDMPTTPFNGVELSEEFQKAAHKLKENTNTRRRENEHDSITDPLGGFREADASTEDIDDLLLSSMGQLCDPI